MVSRETYAKISKTWGGRIYQTYEEIKPRLKLLEKFKEILHGRDVLEIGCNAGMSMYSLAGVVGSYVGLEPSPEYFEQATLTLKALDDASFSVKNMGLKQFSENPTEFDALFASFSLYHLSDEEVAILKTSILPKCKRVLVCNRAEERKVQKNSHRLYVEKNAASLLRESGFSCKTHWYKNKSFYFITARREDV